MTAPARVTLLTQAACAFCDQAKDALVRLSSQFALDVEEIDGASPDGLALAASAGLAFPPGVFIDGNLFSHGRLSERKLRRHLERHGFALPDGET